MVLLASEGRRDARQRTQPSATLGQRRPLRAVRAEVGAWSYPSISTVPARDRVLQLELLAAAPPGPPAPRAAPPAPGTRPRVPSVIGSSASHERLRAHPVTAGRSPASAARSAARSPAGGRPAPSSPRRASMPASCWRGGFTRRPPCTANPTALLEQPASSAASRMVDPTAVFHVGRPRLIPANARNRRLSASNI